MDRKEDEPKAVDAVTEFFSLFPAATNPDDMEAIELSREAFNELCDLGCDKDRLAKLLVLLSLATASFAVGKEPTQRRIRFNAMDSYETAFDGLSLKMLHSKAREAKRVAEAYRSALEGYKQIRETMLVLRRSPGVQFLIERRAITKGNTLWSGSPISRSLPSRLEDPFESALSPDEFESHLAGLVFLPAVAKRYIGEKKRPDLNRRLRAVYAHVYKRTGLPHDDLLQNVLYPLEKKLGFLSNAFALKQWRKRHGVSRRHKP
jgi:hypothetical protein